MVSQVVHVFARAGEKRCSRFNRNSTAMIFFNNCWKILYTIIQSLSIMSNVFLKENMIL